MLGLLPERVAALKTEEFNVRSVWRLSHLLSNVHSRRYPVGTNPRTGRCSKKSGTRCLKN